MNETLIYYKNWSFILYLRRAIIRALGARVLQLLKCHLAVLENALVHLAFAIDVNAFTVENIVLEITGVLLTAHIIFVDTWLKAADLAQHAVVAELADPHASRI